MSDVREYVILGERSAFGRSTIDIQCPFCGQVVEAFVWSLAGSGKRCTNRACRALFDGRGHAKRPDQSVGGRDERG